MFYVQSSKEELQHKYKLISYERVFKMLENNMYTFESVKPFLSYYQALKSGQGITKGIPLLRKSSEK